MTSKTLISKEKLDLIIDRLCLELIENTDSFDNCVLIGIQPKGHFLCNMLVEKLKIKFGFNDLIYGTIDPTFFRDDFRRKEKPLIPNVTNIDFSIENKNIVLIDDVLFTGRTVRSAIDALITFGRPNIIKLMVLIDRQFSRQLPIEANFIGAFINSLQNEKVDVIFESNTIKEIILISD